jgi:hypothetical protein
MLDVKKRAAERKILESRIAYLDSESRLELRQHARRMKILTDERRMREAQLAEYALPTS